MDGCSISTGLTLEPIYAISPSSSRHLVPVAMVRRKIVLTFSLLAPLLLPYGMHLGYSHVPHSLWNCGARHATPPCRSRCSPSFCCYCSGKFGDARNAMTFRGVNQTPHDVIRAVISDLALWSHRLSKADQIIPVGLWRDLFSSRLTLNFVEYTF